MLNIRLKNMHCNLQWIEWWLNEDAQCAHCADESLSTESKHHKQLEHNSKIYFILFYLLLFCLLWWSKSRNADGCTDRAYNNGEKITTWSEDKERESEEKDTELVRGMRWKKNFQWLEKKAMKKQHIEKLTQNVERKWDGEKW